MQHVWINALLAFFEGLSLIITPCIWPILPIILSGSATGKRSRPYGIIIGFILTFTVLTLFSRLLFNVIHISPESLRYTSYILLVTFGVIMLSDYLSEKFNTMTSRLLLVGSSLKRANDNEGGFFGGMIFGGLVGMIFTPCAGPLLAAVIVQAVVQQTTWASVVIVLAFAIGVSVPMLCVAILGRKIMTRFQFIQRYAYTIRRALGALIILSVIYLIYSTSAYALPEIDQTQKEATQLLHADINPYPAPAIAGISDWINSKPLTIESLRGKVVLIDFWTYSCINCIRTLPYIKSWYEKYHDQGLEIIGVHSPEFAFEQDLQNVQHAVKEFGIRYPVALDNRFVTWRNYENQFWPAHYLINQKGEVVYRHFGEGAYDVMENNIRFLLGIKNAMQTQTPDQVPMAALTPEIYLGYTRSQHFATPEQLRQNVIANYHYPERLEVDQWALSGRWTIAAESIESTGSNSRLQLHFNAGVVYAVLGVTRGAMDIEVKNLSNGDVRKLHIKEHQLYTLIELKNGKEGAIEVIAPDPGLEIYTFTFGG